MARLDECGVCHMKADSGVHTMTAEECETWMGDKGMKCESPREHHQFDPIYHCPTCGQHVNR